MTRYSQLRAIFVIAVSGSAVCLYGQPPSLGLPPTAPEPSAFAGKQWGARASTFSPQSSAWFDISNRATVRDSWNLAFHPTSFVPTGWTGDVAANLPGTTTQAFQDAALARINWFRAMAGVPPDITFNPTYSGKDQQAALMFSANRQISHFPPSNWVNYTAAAAEAAANSNICLGFFNDPGCVVAYITDSLPGNQAVGHRRWILYPQTRTMGTGDVPQSGPGGNPYPPANALWVFDGNYGTARPATRDGYVAWPPPGFVPYQVVAPRWSFSYPGANFSAASVSMLRNGQPIPVTLEPVQVNFGENSIVWIPDNLNANQNFVPSAPPSDTTYTVTVTNITGAPQSVFTYTVTVFDPDPVPGVTFSFVPGSTNISSGSTSGSANLSMTPPGSTWTAASSQSWLTITSALSGASNTSILWSASANPSSVQRTASIGVGNAAFTVIQAGAPCAFVLSSTSTTLPAGPGSGSFTVTSTPADCVFGSISYNAPWLSVSYSFTSQGVLLVSFNTQTNNTGAARNATITVANQTFNVTQSAPVISGPQPLRFVPITPCRIVDTRNSAGPFGGPALATGASRDFAIPLSGCGIPAPVVAYSLNMTVVPLGPLGFLSVWPTGVGQPTVSTLNSSDGRIKANAAIVPAGLNGAVTVFASHPTHVIVDINGYFVPAGGPQTLAFYPVIPCRLADTRVATGVFGGPALAASVARTLPVTSGPCGIPANAQAYAMNMTVVPTGGLGFLSAWPAGSPQPGSSTLNAPTGTVTSNLAIVPAGTNGGITVLATNPTDLLIDVTGYFAPPGGAGALDFYTATPCRILDTRNTVGPFGGPQMSSGETRSFAVASSPCGIPTNAKAYSLNATVVPPAPLGFLTLWGGGSMPGVSTLNSYDGSIVANAALIPAGTNAVVTAFTSNASDLILDVNGYFR